MGTLSALFTVAALTSAQVCIQVFEYAYGCMEIRSEDENAIQRLCKCMKEKRQLCKCEATCEFKKVCDN